MVRIAWLAAGLTVLATGANAQTHKFVLVGADDAGTAVLFYDVDDVQNVGQQKTFWSLEIDLEQVGVPRVKSYSMARIKENCSARTNQQIYYQAYDASGSATTSNGAPAAAKMIMPDTFGEIGFGVLCSGSRPYPTAAEPTNVQDALQYSVTVAAVAKTVALTKK